MSHSTAPLKIFFDLTASHYADDLQILQLLSHQYLFILTFRLITQMKRMNDKNGKKDDSNKRRSSTPTNQLPKTRNNDESKRSTKKMRYDDKESQRDDFKLQVLKTFINISQLYSLEYP